MGLWNYLIGFLISPLIASVEDSVDEMENHVKQDFMNGEEALKANNPTHGKECEKLGGSDNLCSNGYNEVNKD